MRGVVILFLLGGICCHLDLTAAAGNGTTTETVPGVHGGEAGHAGGVQAGNTTDHPPVTDAKSTTKHEESKETNDPHFVVGAGPVGGRDSHSAQSTTETSPHHGLVSNTSGHDQTGNSTNNTPKEDAHHGGATPAPDHQDPSRGHQDMTGTPAPGHQDPGNSHQDPSTGHQDPSGHGDIVVHEDDSNGTEHHGNGSDHGNGTHHGHKVERFKVATIDFERVSVPFIISVWVVFASVAKIFFHLNHKIPAIFPESCLLIVLGIVVGLVLYFTDTKGYQLQSDTFFFYLLPPIILEAGYFMPIRSFFDNIGTILCFAVLGTLINTFLIGFSLYAFSLDGIGAIDVSIGPLHCLVFAALISAVDPVAVLAVFDEVAVNEVLHICVFGESLLNDAVTVVLYHMMEGFSHIGKENIVTMDILAGVGSFFIVGLGGTAVGILVGLLAAFMTRFTEHVRVIEPLIVFVMGYISYIGAEIFHLSGIMACVFCGIIMKKYVEVNISRKSHTTIKYFMKMLASLCETVIFMFLGMSTVNDHHVWNTSFVLFSLIFCIVFRALGVIIQCLCLNLVRANKLSKVDQFIMAYGGLRGAIAFSLAVLLNEEVFPEKNMLLTATLVVVYFTVFIQGTTIKPLVKVLRVKTANKFKLNMNEKLHNRLIDHMMAGIEDITGNFGHHELRARFQKVDNMYIKPMVLRKGAARFRGMSIVHVYQKLNERDAQEYLAKKSSFISEGIGESMKNFGNLFTMMTRANSAHSMDSMSSAINGQAARNPKSNGLDPNPTSDLKHKRNASDLPIDNSSTVLDMQALDVQESRKMKDDSKAHHILEDAMFKPRKRFHRHHRHMLPSESTNNFYHHNIRQNLRHMLSHSLAKEYDRRHHHGSKKNREDEEKPRKNVSFANAAELTVKPEHLVPKIEKEEKQQQGHQSDDSSDEGITFTVSKSKDAENRDYWAAQPFHSSPSKRTPAPTPTVTEMTLPWRSAGAPLPEPVSMDSIVAINGEDEPCPGVAPSWVNGVSPVSTSSDNISPPTPINGIGGEVCKMHQSDPNLLEEPKVEEEKHRLSSSEPHLAPGGTRRPHPDIVHCSTPYDTMPWTHKIDDFHEHVETDSNDEVKVNGGPGLVADLAAMSYTDLVLSSDDVVVDGPSTPATTGDDDCYLPATWRTTDEVTAGHGQLAVSNGGGLEVDSTSVGNNSDLQAALPPPWKCSPEQNGEAEGSDSSAQKSNVVFELGPPSESASARSLPWETSPGDVVLDLEEGAVGGANYNDCSSMDGDVNSDIDQSSMRCLSTDSAPVADDCLPPPWRSVNVSEASMPVRSPSASHELDSLVPQASHNSLRLSEAESRHSEQFRGHHHVIDIGPRELEHSSSGTALAAMVGDDAEPLDLVARVQRWLLDTKLQQEPIPDDLYDGPQPHIDTPTTPPATSAAEFSDTVDCEDTYL